MIEKKVVIVWGPGIKGRGGEARLLAHLLRALQELGIDFRVYVTGEISPDDIALEELIQAKDKIFGIPKQYGKHRCCIYTESLGLRSVLSALKQCRKNKCCIIIVRGLDLVINILLLLYQLLGNVRIVFYTGVYGMHHVNIHYLRYYGLYTLNTLNKVRALYGLIKRLPAVPLQVLLSRLIPVNLVLSAGYYIMCVLCREKSSRIRILGYLYPAIDTDFFYYKRLCSYDEKSVLIVSRISSEKKIEYALALVNNVNKLIGDVKVTIVGDIVDNRYFVYIKEFVSRRSLKVNFITRGDPETIRLAYWSHNILINTSLGAFGIVNSEALACGCVPVTHVECIESVGPYGFTFRDFKEAIRVLYHALTHPKELEERGKRGSEWVRQNFSFEALTKRLKLLLEHLNHF